jgi:hypothetical protein
MSQKMTKEIRIKRLGDSGAADEDRNYWLSRPPIERLRALVEICDEYDAWRYPDAQRRLQRVARIVRRP